MTVIGIPVLDRRDQRKLMTALAATARPELRIRRVNLDTGRENFIVLSRRSTALQPEVFRGFSRVELRRNGRVLLATLILTDDFQHFSNNKG